MNRYEWEDALVDAQAAGVIPNGALLLGIKLARAINWSPKNGRPSGLYWKNEEALKAVGASRANYFKHRQSLLETGFFVQENGNLLPQMPKESLLETNESPVETTESPLETEKSLLDNPLSEDTLSEDVLSEEVSTETVPTGPVAEEEPEIREELGTDHTSLMSEGTEKVFPLSGPEKKDFDHLVLMLRATPGQAAGAKKVLEASPRRGVFNERATAVFREVGVEVEEVW